DGSHPTSSSPPTGPADPADEPADAQALSLHDSAVAAPFALAPELEELRAIAADRGADLDLRLEAFQELIDGEVGDTTLARARNLEREVGLRQIYLKFEGGNPTGTQKDRIAFAQCADAIRRGYDGITVATCGNFGASLALAAWLAGLRCVVYIPAGYSSTSAQEMSSYGAEIRRVTADYEGTVEHSREQALRLQLYDANPGGENVSL